MVTLAVTMSSCGCGYIDVMEMLACLKTLVRGTTLKRRFAFIVFLVVLFTLVPATPAWAYIDPATTTYLIQITTAIIITLGVSLSIFLYRFQLIITNIRVFLHALARRLSKEQSGAAATKGTSDRTSDSSPIALTEKDALAAGILDYPIPVCETYPALAGSPLADDAVVPTETDEAAAEKPSFSGRVKAFGHWLWDDKRSFKKRLSKAAFLSAAITMTYGIFNMIDSFITNKSQLIFSLADVIGPILIFALILFLVLSAILLSVRGRVFDFVVFLGFSLLICGYLQSTFFNTGIGQLIGEPLVWEDFGILAVITNMLIWLAIFVTVFTLGLSRRPRLQQFFKSLFLFIPSLLIAVQLVALLSILPPLDEWKGDSKSDGSVLVLSTENLYTVSSSDNVIIIIIDTMDEDYVNMLTDEDPHFFDSLDGFTRFTNNMSLYNMTYPSVANLFTNEPLDTSIPADEYLEKAYAHRSFVNDIKDRGYISDIYTEKHHSYRDEKQLEGLADNIGESNYSLKTWKISLQLFRLSLLKSAPLSLKFIDMLYPDLSYASVGTWKSGVKPYFSDDPLFYEELTSERLNVVSEPRFAFIHLNGFHVPWTMNAKAQYVKEGVPGEEQFKGSFFIIAEYLNQLKELGLYKDATIIITGDHPHHRASQAPEKPMLVGLFVKPSGEEGTPLRYSTAPVSVENLRATCVEAAGGDKTPWGRTYFEVGEDEIIERHYYNRFTDEKGDHYMAHYRVIGDANKWENWELVEMVSIKPENWF